MAHRVAALAIGLVVVVQAAEVTPIQKVLTMMGEMKTKAQEEKEAEIATFNEFMKFCKVTTREKGYAIKDATAKIGKLSADIEDYDAKAMVLGKDITTLDTTIDETEHEKAEAAEVRQKANKDYQETHADYVLEIEELEVGIADLKKMMSSTSAASSFIQKMVSRPRLSKTARKVLTSFLATGSAMKLAQPAAPAFEGQSDGVIEMMEDLKDKLTEEKSDLETEEMNEEHEFQMVAQALDNQIKSDSEKRSEKASTKKQMESDSAVAKGDLADTTHMKGEDEKYTADLTTLCEEKSEDFTARQKMRAEELVAIDKAMEIIGGQGVAGAGAKHLPSLVQGRPVALAQLRNGNSAQLSNQVVASNFLHAQGRMLNSRVLSALAIRVSADPFVKVRKMIQDMIAKLQQEASDEAEHKGFCDTEMSTNEATREQKTARVEELTANIEEMTAASQKLATEIADLNKEITEIDAAVKSATEIRGEEKAKNTVTIADAKVAIAAVEQATKVLKDFYAKAAGATALVQVRAGRRGPEDDVPATFDEPFTGTGGEGGVIGMLEVILSDFQRLEEETTSTETAAAAEYKTFSTDSAEDRETKRKSAYHKGNEVSKVEHDIHLAKKDLAATQKELDAALEYFEKLKPSCVDAGVSYEDRVAQRKQEIESLGEALKILESEA